MTRAATHSASPPTRRRPELPPRPVEVERFPHREELCRQAAEIGAGRCPTCAGPVEPAPTGDGPGVRCPAGDGRWWIGSAQVDADAVDVSWWRETHPRTGARLIDDEGRPVR